jgi:hypothetical protein
MAVAAWPPAEEVEAVSLKRSRGVERVAVEAVVGEADPTLVGVAAGAGRAEVSAAQREAGLVVIEAREAEVVGAVAVVALASHLSGVRIDVADGADRHGIRSARRVTALAGDRPMAAFEREDGVVVIEARAAAGEREGWVGVLVATAAVASDVAMSLLVASGALALRG